MAYLQWLRVYRILQYLSCLSTHTWILRSHRKTKKKRRKGNGFGLPEGGEWRWLCIVCSRLLPDSTAAAATASPSIFHFLAVSSLTKVRAICERVSLVWSICFKNPSLPKLYAYASDNILQLLHRFCKLLLSIFTVNPVEDVHVGSLRCASCTRFLFLSW
jgi:hypothetical protein